MEPGIVLGVVGLGLRGQGDLVSRLMMGIPGVTIWLIGSYRYGHSTCCQCHIYFSSLVCLDP